MSQAEAKVTISLPRHLLEQVEREVARRETTLENVIRLSLRRYVRMPDVFALDTPMSFGQYKGEKIADLISTEPRYVLWCLVNIAGFTLAREAQEVLDSQLPEEGVVVRRYQQDGFEEVRVVPGASE